MSSYLFLLKDYINKYGIVIRKEAILRPILDDTITVRFHAAAHEHIIQQDTFFQRQSTEIMERPGWTVRNGCHL